MTVPLRGGNAKKKRIRRRFARQLCLPVRDVVEALLMALLEKNFIFRLEDIILHSLGALRLTRPAGVVVPRRRSLAPLVSLPPTAPTATTRRGSPASGPAKELSNGMMLRLP